MSYRQRERKRRMKAAAGGVAQRRSHESASAAARWWLTLVRQDCACARCGLVLRVGREMVYRKTPRESRCVACAELDAECRWRPSLAWEKARR